MKKYYALFAAIVFATNLFGQPAVTFQVTLEELVDSGFFSGDEGDKIFVSGSFDQWGGAGYELIKSADPHIFSGTFQIGNTGDTISYKFVVQKGNGPNYWEKRPNPDNPDNGNRQLVLSKNKLVLPVKQFCFDEYISYPVIFGVEKLQQDYLQFRDILESTHPALYDYTPKETLDSIFDVNYGKINAETDFDQFLMLMTEVISKVGCGHSSLWIPGKYWIVAPKRLFPLQMFNVAKGVIVTGNYKSPNGIPRGSEIVAVNDQPIDFILEKLEDLTSADGFNPSYRSTKAVQNFSVKYANAFGFPDSFIVDYKPPGETNVIRKTIAPVSKSDVDKCKSRATELSFERMEQNSTGILTINTFGYYSRVEMFQSFIDSVFNEIKQNDTRNLILDLRGNSGGDPFCAAYLWKYLQPRSLPYFIDHYGRYDTLANPIAMPENNFEGKLFTLIDGNGFSTTGHFCGLLKYHNVGKFIGSELGATYTCTGNATYPPLKNTGIMVGTARVRRYTAAVEGMDPKRGVMPDYQVGPAQNDIMEGKDVVMDFALSLTKQE